MNAFERVKTVLEGGIPDRVPVFPQIGDHAGILSGLTIDVMYRDATKAAEAHLAALARYGYDVVTIQVEPSWPMVQACGGEINYPPDKCPWITKNPITCPDDLDNFAIPDFATAPGSSVMVEGTRLLAAKADVPVVAFVTGPLTFSMQLFPYTEFVTASKKNKEFIHRLVQKSVEVINAYSAALRQAGATILMVCEHDIQMFSPEFAREFSLPFLEEVFTYDYNMLHMCGKVERHLRENAVEFKQLRKLNMINVGHEANLKEIKKLFAGHFGVAGNLDHIVFLPHRTPAEVEQKCREIIEAGMEGGGFMLAPGCEITIDVPPENIEAMVRAAEKYGRY